MAKLPVEKLKASKKPIPVKIVSDYDSPCATARDEGRERKWKAEDALRTVKEYEKIKSDKQLMGDVKKMAKEEMNKLKKIC